MTQTTSAQKIADYILWSSHETGSFVTNPKLQKLLYYVQAWHLAVYERPLFPERFEAWIHGPVIPSLHLRYKPHQWRSIDEDVSKPDLPSATVAFVEDVLDEYGPLDARRLDSLVRQEAPWLEARGGLAADEPCQAEISEERMGSFYRARLSNDEIRAFRDDDASQFARPQGALADG